MVFITITLYRVEEGEVNTDNCLLLLESLLPTCILFLLSFFLFLTCTKKVAFFFFFLFFLHAQSPTCILLSFIFFPFYCILFVFLSFCLLSFCLFVPMLNISIKDPPKAGSPDIIGQKSLLGNVLVVHRRPINSRLDIMTPWYQTAITSHWMHYTLHTTVEI